MAVSIPSKSLVSRSPIFYGWFVWMVATIGLIATSPGQSFSVSLFFDKFITEFGLDRTGASGLYGLGTFIGALSLTWVGRKIDQHGNRRMGTIISLLFALILMAFSTIASPIALLFGFIGIRGLGQGSLGLVNTTVVAQWFKLRRGRVLAVSSLTFALFQGIYVNWLRVLLETYDWRMVWIILGLGVAFTILPLIFFFFRDKPEDFGLLPDGEVIDVNLDALDKSKIPVEDSWTLKEALQTPLMWIFLMARLIPPAWGTGLILHQVSIFSDLGHSAQVATETYGLMAIFSAIFSIVVGYLVDHLNPSRIVALQMTAMLMACAMATLMTESWMLIIYAISFGFVMGSGTVFDGAVWVNLFGRGHQGAIRGFVSTVGVIGSAVGPTLFGISYDYAGGYSVALWGGAMLCVIAIISSFFATLPKRKLI